MSTPAGRTVTSVAAVAENGVIGGDADMLWHIPEDFAHFKATTIGHTLIMGRTTHEGIGRPLPGRTTIVLTRDTEWSDEGVLVAHSIEEALGLADTLTGEVMIGGGAAVYEAAMPYVDVQILSEVPLSPEGDAFYPEFDRDEWLEVRREPRDGFEIVWWERRTA
ncbi:dihydrofolate reductase [Nocardioides cavernaquae]|uniref:Dihydrofolate reductase n=1 Tax=Nocardioides cavernaquae TaxID=2321396 RepID=A0A3A5HI09_9ACTN|nr:dihydrofolate reductase [Nocardioides cavernaquae]RJS47520.1 dihydrofolate reductase [Nocardioides cavernaquae]